MLDRVRHGLHRVITSDRGDDTTALRVPKQMARGFNEMLGSPLCSEEELSRRKAAAERLAQLLQKPTDAEVGAPSIRQQKSKVPVMVYFDKDRNPRELARIEETLKAKNIDFERLEVGSDASTRTFACREANCDEDELPVVFVGGKPIGTFRQLVQSDASGELGRLLGL